MKFESLDFYDQSTDLHFHKLNPSLNGGDDHFYSLINKWDSENIRNFLTTPLGNSLRHDAQLEPTLDNYVVLNKSMEVIGATTLEADVPIIGFLDLFDYINKFKDKKEPHFLTLENAQKLLSHQNGLYVSTYVSNTELERQGYGTKILKAIANNATLLNHNISPLCTMALVKITNEFSKKALLKAGFETIPYCYEGFSKFYKMNEREL